MTNIYISTCDKTLYTIDVFQKLFNKYWSSEKNVIVLGYTCPNFKLENNFKFVSLGKDRGPKYFSEDVLRYLNENVKDKYIIHAWDDAPIISKVDQSKIVRLREFMENNDTFKKACLTPDLGTRAHLNVNDEFIKASPDADYKLATTWQMWEVDYFKKYLSLDYSPWDIELKASEIAKNDGFDVLSFKKSCPVNTCNIIRGGKSGRAFIRKNFFKNLGNYIDYPDMDIIDQKTCLNVFKKHNKIVAMIDR